MKLSDRGANLIANFEGFRSCPYKDAVGVWTIGYGSTKGVGPNANCISKAQALERMKREVDATYGKAVNDLPVIDDLTQNQFDALASFVYNLGPGAINSKTGIGQALRRKQWNRAADEMLEWDKAGGRVLAGLKRRRREERELFLEKEEPDPIKWSDDERYLVRLINDPSVSKERKDRAKVTLRKHAATIQKRAQSERNGWEQYDRGRRYRGIRRVLAGKPAQWW
jgi:GH24 family phage-related lysozyme (muramidase)